MHSSCFADLFYKAIKQRNTDIIHLKVSIKELYDNSIITNGFVIPKGYILKSATYRHNNKRYISVIKDSIVTPEISILYSDFIPEEFKNVKNRRLNLTLYSEIYNMKQKLYVEWLEVMFKEGCYFKSK